MSRYYKRVAERAGNRCEYCRAPEIVFNMQFEVDHILPRSRGGANSFDNLALSCPVCNLFKSDFETGADDADSHTADLFHPRMDKWLEHFRVETQTAEIVGITAKGRATVNRLQLNRFHQVNARHRWMILGLFP
jgi:hypothetical protein